MFRPNGFQSTAKSRWNIPGPEKHNRGHQGPTIICMEICVLLKAFYHRSWDDRRPCPEATACLRCVFTESHLTSRNNLISPGKWTESRTIPKGFVKVTRSKLHTTLRSTGHAMVRVQCQFTKHSPQTRRGGRISPVFSEIPPLHPHGPQRTPGLIMSKEQPVGSS